MSQSLDTALSRAGGVAIGVLFALFACDGPSEQAGERADIASGAVRSGDPLTSGPAERSGELADEAARSAREATEARADALDEEADAVRDGAAQSADALEQKANQLRKNEPTGNH